MRERVRALLKSSEGQREALEAFDRDVLAPKSVRTRQSKLDTLLTFAAEAGVALFPLRRASLGMLVGAMKLAGCKSANSYVSVARVRHVELRYPMSDELRAFLKGAERSAVRNTGPVKRAPVIDPIELATFRRPRTVE